MFDKKMKKFKSLKESKYVKRTRKILSIEWTVFIKKINEYDNKTKIKPFNP